MVAGINLPAAQLQIAMGISLHRISEIRLLYGMVWQIRDTYYIRVWCTECVIAYPHLIPNHSEANGPYPAHPAHPAPTPHPPRTPHTHTPE